MNFKLKLGKRRNQGAEAPTFRVERLWSEVAGREAEVSHMIDRTYGYHSLRELQWHLADRFGVPLGSFELRAA